MQKLKNRRLKDGIIKFFPCQKGLAWEVAFQFPRCAYLAKRVKKWDFEDFGVIDISLSDKKFSEIHLYRLALERIMAQLEEWHRIVVKADEYDAT